MMRKGQAAIEYLTYFAFFLLIAAAFSSLVFTQSGEELSKRSQQRFRSTLVYVAESVRDANRLALHADSMEFNITLPVVVKGAGITIEGNGATGLVQGNTTVGRTDVYYYIKIGSYNVDVSQEKYGDENVITIKKQ